jgi:hypothetical protein
LISIGIQLFEGIYFLSPTVKNEVATEGLFVYFRPIILCLKNQELERTLWLAADKLRSNMDAAEYKHVVLGLIFLKYISDAFDAIERMFVEEIGPDWESDTASVKDICLSKRVFCST